MAFMGAKRQNAYIKGARMKKILKYLKSLLANLLWTKLLGEYTSKIESDLKRLNSYESLNEALLTLSSLTDTHSKPNINPLWDIAKHQELIRQNIKNYGYELAKSVSALIPPKKELAPQFVGLRSKPSTQSDIESDWCAYWCQKLNVPPIYHRKIWELAFVCQALYEKGMLSLNKRGLGFGCGQEPLPSLFASMGASVTITDLDPEVAAGLGWAETGQHASMLELTHYPDIVDKQTYNDKVTLEYVDMNDIPAKLNGSYDFCWSICALEHLGSIQKGLEFIRNSLAVLKPGGIAVHTTEFNFANNKETVDNWMTVFFQQVHFEKIANILRADGHIIEPLDFDVGEKPLDKYIDMPPYLHDTDKYDASVSALQNLKNHAYSTPPHIKVALDGFAVTCYGLIIQKSKNV